MIKAKQSLGPICLYINMHIIYTSNDQISHLLREQPLHAHDVLQGQGHGRGGADGGEQEVEVRRDDEDVVGGDGHPVYWRVGLGGCGECQRDGLVSTVGRGRVGSVKIPIHPNIHVNPIKTRAHPCGCRRAARRWRSPS